MFVKLRNSLIAAILALPGVCHAQAASGGVSEFFAGRSIVFVSPYDDDKYSKSIARHMVKYAPGNPSIRFRHMPGGRSRKIAAWLSSEAPRDGLIVAALLPDAIMAPLIGEGKSREISYDPLQFLFLGSANSSTLVCLSDRAAPVQDFGEALRTPLILGATRDGGMTRDMALALKNIIGARFTLVPGYKDVDQVIRALKHGEVQGLCGYGWSNFNAGRLDLIKNGQVNVLVQLALDPHEGLSSMKVPMIWEYVDDPEVKETLQLIATAQYLGRPFAAAPGVERKRLNALRVAFERTMRDVEFRADARRAGIEINPTTGDSVQKLVKKIFATPKPILNRARLARKAAG